MSFFKDFKADFTQAVNELIPDSDEMTSEYDDEDMVNTFDADEKEPEGSLPKKAKTAKKSKFFSAFASQSDEMIVQDEAEEEPEDDFEIAPEDLLDDIEDADAASQSTDSETDRAIQEKPISDEQIPDSEQHIDAAQNVEDAQMSFDFLSNAMQMTQEEESKAEESKADMISEDMVGEAAKADESYYVPDEEPMSDSIESAVTDMPDEMTDTQDSESETYDETENGSDTEESNANEVDTDEEVPVDENNSAISDDEYVDTLDLDHSEPDTMKDQSDEMHAEESEHVDIPEKQEAVQNEAEVEEKTMVSVEEQTVQEVSDSVTETATTYITKGTKITGDIETEGSIDIIGDVIGNVNCKGKLVLGGHIEGNVSVGEIYANSARIDGDVSCDGSAKIGVGSVVVGKVAGTSAVIAGAVNGDIDVHGPVIVDSTAVIMGNIKSKSVQINNGAVIEGFCSQCYSEIDVKSFFS